VFNRLKDEIQQLYIILGGVAGKEPTYDSELRGRIAATKALIEVEFDDVYPEES
jgi:hypothetical protein